MNTESVRRLKLGTRYIWYPDTDVVQGSSCCTLYEARSWPVIFPRRCMLVSVVAHLSSITVMTSSSSLRPELCEPSFSSYLTSISFVTLTLNSSFELCPLSVLRPLSPGHLTPFREFRVAPDLPAKKSNGWNHERPAERLSRGRWSEYGVPPAADRARWAA